MIPMTTSSLKSQAFKLKGRLYTLTVLSVLEKNSDEFNQHLAEVVSQAPKFFHQTPIVLDFSELPAESIDLADFIRCVREQGLIPVAIQHGQAALDTLAPCHGLAVLHASSSHDKNLLEETGKTPMVQQESSQTKIITTPVRSGQQIVSSGDLIVTSAVSHGAELLANGHIHVYGALRGRALAGIGGDTSARIFCQSLEAELVSIAGFYRLSDAIASMNGPCQIILNASQHIEVLPI